MMQHDKSFIEIINEYQESDEILLPVLDEIALNIQQEVAKDDADITRIEKLICNDPSLTSQVLKTANSTFYKGLSKVSTVLNAIIRLGAGEISNIVTFVTQKKNFYSKDPFCRNVMEELWRHSAGCAIGAQWIAKESHSKELAHEAFAAGLLHDIGKLFLIKVVEMLNLSEKTAIKPSAELLNEVMENFHSERGYSLLKNWNLPETYCNIARDHHSEEFDSNDILMTIVRLVNKTCNKLGIGLNKDPSLVLAATPEAHVLGLSELFLAKLEITIEDSMGLV
jgi:HD-like signal output (HDOD) protein